MGAHLYHPTNPTVGPGRSASARASLVNFPSPLPQVALGERLAAISRMGFLGPEGLRLAAALRARFNLPPMPAPA